MCVTAVVVVATTHQARDLATLHSNLEELVSNAQLHGPVRSSGYSSDLDFFEKLLMKEIMIIFH